MTLPRWTPVAAGVVLLVGGVLLVGVGRSAGPVGAGSPDGWSGTITAQVSTTAPGTATVGRLNRILAVRSAALVNAQRSRFLAASRGSDRTDQARLFRRLSAAPLADYSAVVVGQPRLATTGGRVRAEVRVRYRLDGDRAATTRHVRTVFARNDGDWLLAAWRPARPDLWDLGPVRAVHDGRVLVLGASSRARLVSAAADARTALRAVRQLWPFHWAGRVTVVLPGSAADLAALVGLPRAELRGLGAMTTGEASPLTTEPALRVTLNPRYYSGLSGVARQILLRHEITHVAQYGLDPAGLSKIPTWLSEGVAEYVGYRDSGVPFPVVASDLLDRVRQGRDPVLPTDAGFAFDRGAETRALAYRAGWSACVFVAEHYGEDQLLNLYLAVADGHGSPGRRVQVAVSKTIGVHLATLTRRWHAWLRDQT